MKVHIISSTLFTLDTSSQNQPLRRNVEFTPVKQTLNPGDNRTAYTGVEQPNKDPGLLQ